MSKVRSLLIQNAHLFDPSNELNETGDVLIEAGKISRIGGTIAPNSDIEKCIDATGLSCLPGLIDMATYLRQPGLGQKARVSHECMAAAQSGISRLCALPEPQVPLDNTEMVNWLKNKANQSGGAYVNVIGALTQGANGENITPMQSLQQAGCVGVMQNLQYMADNHTLMLALKYAKSHGLTVHVQANDPYLMQEGGMHEGEFSTRMGLPGIPSMAENLAIDRILSLAKHTGATIHIGRLSTAEGVHQIDLAKRSGINVTADVAMHQLFLTHQDVCEFNALCHVIPPLRSESDREALRKGVSDGIIDIICSDHQPHENDAKLAPMQFSAPGISAIDTFLPLMMRLVTEGVLDLETALQRCCHAPAKLIGCEHTLTVGQPAFISLIDSKVDYSLSPDMIHSQGKNSPFMDWDFNAQAVAVVNRKRLILNSHYVNS